MSSSSSDEEESSSVLICDPEDVVIFAEPLGAASGSAVADALQLADLARSQAASSTLSGDEQYKRSVTLLKGGEEVLRQLDDERKSTRSAFNSLRLSRAHSAAAAAVSAPSQGHVATVTVGATDDDAAKSKPTKAKKAKKTRARVVDGAAAAAAATSNNSHTWNAQIDIEALATAVEHGAQVSAFLLSSLTKRDRELLEQKLLAKQQERMRARRILEEQLALVAAADQRTSQYMTLIRGQPEPADDAPDASNDTVVFQPAPDIDASEIAALSDEEDDDNDDNSEDEDAAKSSRPSVIRKTAALAAGSSSSRVAKDVAQSPPRPIVVDETATATTTTTTTQSERVAADVSVASPRRRASAPAPPLPPDNVRVPPSPVPSPVSKLAEWRANHRKESFLEGTELVTNAARRSALKAEMPAKCTSCLEHRPKARLVYKDEALWLCAPCLAEKQELYMKHGTLRRQEALAALRGKFMADTALDVARQAGKETLRSVRKICGKCGKKKAQHTATMTTGRVVVLCTPCLNTAKERRAQLDAAFSAPPKALQN
jgi:hypothetical protein